MTLIAPHDISSVWSGNTGHGLVHPSFQELWKGLAFVAMPDPRGNVSFDRVIDRPSPFEWSISGSTTITANRYGVAWDTASGVIGSADTASIQPDWDNVGLMVVADWATGAVSQNVVVKRSGTVSTRQFYALMNADESLSFGTNSPSASSVSTGAGVITDGPQVMLFTAFGSSSYRVTVNGAIVSEPSTRVTGDTGTSPWVIGRRANNSDADPFLGSVNLVAFWNRNLSIAEMQLLAADPFGLVRPIWDVPAVTAFPELLAASLLSAMTQTDVHDPPRLLTRKLLGNRTG